MNTQRQSRIRTGFTLVELLAVLAVIMVLVALLLPVLGRMHARAVRAQCLSNIKQVDLILLMYGHENSDRLPQTTSMYTLPQPLVDTATRGRVSHQVFYDPGIEGQSENWFNPMAGTSRPIGYCLTLPGSPGLIPSNINATILPQPISRGLGLFFPPPNASERVLVAGATFLPQFFSAMDAHVNSQNYPMGDNVAMLDGSASWRKFKDMIPRSLDGTGGPADLGQRW